MSTKHNKRATIVAILSLLLAISALPLSDHTLAFAEAAQQEGESQRAAGQDGTGSQEDAGTADSEVESDTTPALVSDENDAREAQVFDANSYIKNLKLTLTSGETTKSYEAASGETIDTRADFPDGLSRTASYSSTIVLDTKSMLEAQGKYPFVTGDTVTCRVPDLIRLTQGTTSGRLRDTTADWDGEHNGVGDYSVSQDADGNNILTIKYDDGYIAEKNGKILSTTVRISGGFDTSSKTTESFYTDLIFGDATVKATFSKLEIIRNLSIEKTGTVNEDGICNGYSSPAYLRKGSADISDDGYLTYSVAVKAGSDNTYKLTNVCVTDLFDSDSQSKIDLSTMQLVSVINDGVDTTSKASALYDADGKVNGWNIGDLGIDCSATVTFKVKINKSGITDAVDAAKAVDGSSDALDARTIKNTATATADETEPVTDDYSTYVENYLQVVKSTSSYDWTTQSQLFKVTVTSPSDNRYTMHNVPIYDYLTSYLDAKYYKESGIKSISVKHSDGTTETLTFSDFKQDTTHSWHAKISEIKPGDMVTVTTYLTFSDEYWTRYANAGQVGDIYQRCNRVYVGNVGGEGYESPDLNDVYSYSYFLVYKNVLVKNSPNIKSDGTVNWVITGNERATSATPSNVAGLVLNDTLGPNQEFEDGTASVVFYNQDGSVAGRDTIELTAGSTAFTYTIPEKYGTCEYRISYTSKITDWETYVGPAKKYSNTVNGWTSYTTERSRVASMDKAFVEQADNWSKWETKIYSELTDGDTYVDTSRNGKNYMYFTQEDLDDISLTIDGVDVDSNLYQIEFNDTATGDQHVSYKITFKGDVSVTKDGTTVTPSSSTPLVISYKAHMVNPGNGSRDYYNDAKLTAGSVVDTDYDYCRRNKSTEITKAVDKSSSGSITWYVRSNYYGYSGQPDGTCTITDTIPAGLTYEGITVKSSVNYGKLESATPVVNEDGTTTLTIKVSGLKHDEVCKAHPNDHNGSYEFQFYINTKISDPEYLYGSTSKTFSYVNQISLNDRYGNLKTATATANIKHAAINKTMEYNESIAPYAQFSILANKDKVDLNANGDTVGIVDVTSKTLSVDTKSISVVDATTGDTVDFTVDTSKMSENQLTIHVPDATYVKITYQAQVIGVAGQSVQVSNSAYYEAYKSISDENSIDESVVVLKSSGESESEPMVWLAKKNESAAALGGAQFKLESYDQATKQWKTLRTDITSTSSSTSKGLKIESLELDTLYRLVETQAPDGYVLDTTPHYFVLMRDSAPTVTYPDDVDADDVFVGTPGSVINAYNLPYTKVRFVKNSDDSVQLAGAQFSVYKVSSDGTVDTTPAQDADGNEVTFTSSSDAMNEFTLAPGTYQLVETKAPAGYEKSDPVTFVVAGNADRAVTVNGETVQSGTGDAIQGGVSVVDTTGKTSLEVAKVWDDAENQDGKRPTSVIVQLYADGEAVEGSSVELTEDNNWVASFADLSVMKAGQTISYSVKELDPETGEAVESGDTMSNGYKSTVSAVSGDVAGGAAENYSVSITNSYTPAKTSLTVSKVWDDAENQDGKRPTSVTVQLYADGEAQEGSTVELTEDNEWTATFEDIDVMKAGQTISYSVKELDPETGEAVESGDTMSNGYTVEVVADEDAEDGSHSVSITNSREPEKTTVSVTKMWSGDDESTRPASITVELLKDDEVIDSAVIEPNEDGEWTCEFTDLDKYEAGKEIEYTVKETEVPEGYTSELSGDKDSGFVITNTKVVEPTPETPSTPDNGSSKKTSKKSNSGIPQTGDQNALLTIVGAVGVLVLFAGIEMSRKLRKN